MRVLGIPARERGVEGPPGESKARVDGVEVHLEHHADLRSAEIFHLCQHRHLALLLWQLGEEPVDQGALLFPSRLVERALCGVGEVGVERLLRRAASRGPPVLSGDANGDSHDPRLPL